MARKIDLTKKLSGDDRHYLVVRDRWRDLAVADGHNDPRRAQREASQSFSASQRSMPGIDPTAPPPAVQPNDPNVNTGGDDDDDALEPYEEWNYQDLQAELKERGLPAGGKQDELVARLYEDDKKA